MNAALSQKPIETFRLRINEDALYICLTEFNGDNYVHLRYFYEDWDELQFYPKKIGVAFTVAEFEELMTLIPEMKDTLEMN